MTGNDRRCNGAGVTDNLVDQEIKWTSGEWATVLSNHLMFCFTVQLFGCGKQAKPLLVESLKMTFDSKNLFYTLQKKIGGYVCWKIRLHNTCTMGKNVFQEPRIFFY